MSNRYHLPVTVITEEHIEKNEARDSVEIMLGNLVESEGFLRIFVEDDGLDEEQVERLGNILSEIDPDDMVKAADTIDHITVEVDED